MNRAQKTTLIIVALAIVAAVIYFALRQRKTAAANAETDAGDATQLTLPSITFPIKEGSRGETGTELQRAANRYLNAHPAIQAAYPDVKTLIVDGIWGVKTAKAMYYCFNVGEMGVLNMAQYETVINMSMS
jgi:hypothetical protein